MYPTIFACRNMNRERRNRPPVSQRNIKGTKRNPADSSLRIIGGEWRSRKIRFLEQPGLRPTGDRVRETLFNWLTQAVPGARCIDLFAGTGALGFEALSRGAAHCEFYDINPATIKRLRLAANELKASNLHIKCADALQAIDAQADTPFDIAFVDPPFSLDLVNSSCALLEQNGWLTNDAFIYCETERSATAPPTPDNWTLQREKMFGDVCGRLYRRIEPAKSFG